MTIFPMPADQDPAHRRRVRRRPDGLLARKPDLLGDESAAIARELRDSQEYAVPMDDPQWVAWALDHMRNAGRLGKGETHCLRDVRIEDCEQRSYR